MLNFFSSFIQRPATKKVVLSIWIALIITAIVLYLLFPQEFTANGIKEFIAQFSTTAIVIYFVVSLIRGLFLIPSTPFVLAGALLFPEKLWMVFIISILGILGSGIFIYHAAQFLKFGEVNTRKINRINEQVRKHGFWIVLGWSFFPIVPTDLICYVAGRAQINFWKYISALFIGEALLIALYLSCYQYFLDYY